MRELSHIVTGLSMTVHGFGRAVSFVFLQNVIFICTGRFCNEVFFVVNVVADGRPWASIAVNSSNICLAPPTAVNTLKR